MDAYVQKIEVPINEEVGMTLYKVVYCYVQGNGYDTGSLWADFNVYEKEEVANAVAKGIEEGIISPRRR
jgi:hypothetical protein